MFAPSLDKEACGRVSGGSPILGRSRKRSGFTLIEVASSVVLASVILSAVSFVVVTFSRVVREHTEEYKLRRSGTKSIQRIFEALAEADAATITPLLLANAPALTYTPIGGGDSVTLGFTLVAGEELNGTDDNGDGRADEGVFTRTQSSTTTTLAVDVLGVRFSATSTGIRGEIDVGVLVSGTLRQQTFTAEHSFRLN